MKMVLLIIWMVMIGLSVGLEHIDKTEDPIDCDLGGVGVDQAVSCPITIQEKDLSPSGQGSTITVRNSLNIIDSNGENSYCKDPRIDLNYIQNDFDGADEYLQIFEGLTTDPSGLIKRCEGKEELCVRAVCLTDEPLNNQYAVGESVHLTMFVSGAVDGIHWNGNDLCPPNNYQIDSEITFKCTRGECPRYFKWDAASSKCVRDCGSFAINEYLECSTLYNDDQSSIDKDINDLEADVGTLKNTVNVDHENRIKANEDAIKKIQDETIPNLIANLQGQINTNANDIDTLETTTIPDLKTELNGKIKTNADDIDTLEITTIPNLESALKAKMAENVQAASTKAAENLALIKENEEGIAAFGPVVSGASAMSVNPSILSDNKNTSILSDNRDLLLLMSLLINIFVLSTSLVLCVKLNKANKYTKVASFASDA